MGRWTAPDPYNGSYDLANPQSLNRYAYVNNNPLGFVDPSGKTIGWLTGGGSPCKYANKVGKIPSIPLGDGLSINPCNPIASIVSVGLTATINGIWGAGTVAMGEITPFVAAAITIACSIDSNKAACGPSGWTSVVIGGNAGKVVGDSIAVAGDALLYEFGPACAASAGNPANPACDYVYAVAIYNALNDLFSVLWDAFGPAQFKGSLLPRPGALDGLGSSATGIPNNNLSIQDIMGQPSQSIIPSPGMSLP